MIFIIHLKKYFTYQGFHGRISTRFDDQDLMFAACRESVRKNTACCTTSYYYKVVAWLYIWKTIKI